MSYFFTYYKIWPKSSVNEDEFSIEIPPALITKGISMIYLRYIIRFMNDTFKCFISSRREQSYILKFVSVISIFHSNETKLATINLDIIQNKDNYEKSTFKDINEDMENTKNKGLESVPRIRKEQVPSKDETSNEILYGGHNDKDE
jgi:hypothetical protein